MTIKIRYNKKSNPQQPDQKKWYGCAIKSGDVTLNEMATQISIANGIPRKQTKSLLNSFIKMLCDKLNDGYIVRLSDFGVFQTAISTIGKEAPQPISTDDIRNRKLLFRPGSRVKQMLSNLEFVSDQSTSTNIAN